MKTIQQISEECFEAIIKSDKFEVKDIKKLPQLQPLKIQQHDIPYQGAHNNQNFVPSLDLMQSYQSTYTRTIDKTQQPPQKLINARLQKLYAGTNQMYNNTFQAKQHMLNSNVITVQNKQQHLLEGLQKRTIQATIPLIEQSLQKNEIRNLEKKEVFIQNNLTFKQLKQMRLKLQEEFKK